VRNAGFTEPRQDLSAGGKSWWDKSLEIFKPSAAEQWRTGKAAQQSNLIGSEIAPEFFPKTLKKAFDTQPELNNFARERPKAAEFRNSDRKYDRPEAISAREGTDEAAQRLAKLKPGEPIPDAEEGLSAVDLGYHMIRHPKNAEEVAWNADQLYHNATEYAHYSDKDILGLGKRTANIYRSQRISKPPAERGDAKGFDGEVQLRINPKTDFVKSYPIKTIQDLADNPFLADLYKIQKLADFGALSAKDKDKIEAAELIWKLLDNEKLGLKSHLNAPTLEHIRASTDVGELAPLVNRSIDKFRARADDIRRRYADHPAISTISDNLENELKRLQWGTPKK